MAPGSTLPPTNASPGRLPVLGQGCPRRFGNPLGQASPVSSDERLARLSEVPGAPPREARCPGLRHRAPLPPTSTSGLAAEWGDGQGQRGARSKAVSRADASQARLLGRPAAARGLALGSGVSVPRVTRTRAGGPDTCSAQSPSSAVAPEPQPPPWLRTAGLVRHGAPRRVHTLTRERCPPSPRTLAPRALVGPGCHRAPPGSRQTSASRGTPAVRRPSKSRAAGLAS